MYKKISKNAIKHNLTILIACARGGLATTHVSLAA